MSGRALYVLRNRYQDSHANCGVRACDARARGYAPQVSGGIGRSPRGSLAMHRQAGACFALACAIFGPAACSTYSDGLTVSAQGATDAGGNGAIGGGGTPTIAGSTSGGGSIAVAGAGSGARPADDAGAAGVGDGSDNGGASGSVGLGGASGAPGGAAGTGTGGTGTAGTAGATGAGGSG